MQRTMDRKKARNECCSDLECGSGLRNRYYFGKRLTPASFRVEQEYALERRRLLNRAMHGWGVVYGFQISAIRKGDPWTGKIEVGKGLAFDQCGRELEQTGDRAIELDSVIVVDGEGHEIGLEKALSRAADSDCWLLSVVYAEQDLGSTKIEDPCRCDHDEWDQVCETVRYTLELVDCEKCCGAADCDLSCTCGSGACCDPGTAGDQPADLRKHRGGCRCLCEYTTDLTFEGCGKLTIVEEPCGGSVRVDLCHRVPLACVKIVRDACQDWGFSYELDACGPRRMVKRNDLLFDLIRGCDLTRLKEIGWKWHRREEPVEFNDFSQALGPEGYKEPEYVTRDFWIRFSRPVRRDTVRPDCFRMVVAVRERGGWIELRVPIVRIEYTLPPEVPPDPEVPEGTVDPPNTVRVARVVVDGPWLEAARGDNRFDCTKTFVEIEVFGDFIVDCNGQAVDANSVGLLPLASADYTLEGRPVLTGNGTPGGTFRSGFPVGPRTPH